MIAAQYLLAIYLVATGFLPWPVLAVVGAAAVAPIRLAGLHQPEAGGASSRVPEGRMAPLVCQHRLRPQPSIRRSLPPWVWLPVPSSSDPHSSVERQIQDAMARGEFDRLPGLGRPIPGIDGDDQPDWWARKKIESERALHAAVDAASAVQRAMTGALGARRPCRGDRRGRPSQSVARTSLRLSSPRTSGPNARPG